MIQNPKKIIFNISGGAGKNIMATAVVNSIREQFPDSKIILTTPHTVVWENNPDIDELVNSGNDTTIFEKYLKGGEHDTIFLSNDPYLHEDFIYKREHLIETWCKQFGITYNDSMPKLYFTDEEIEKVKEKLPQGKPLFFIQVSGGPANQPHTVSWTRDIPIPTAQAVTDQMIKEGYEIIQIRRKDQFALENVPFVDLNMREAMIALLFANKLLLIDSVMQHAAAAVGKKAVVLWVGHRSENFGYTMHTNITSSAEIKFRHHLESYLDHYDLTGRLTECPFDTNELFDSQEILKKLLD